MLKQYEELAVLEQGDDGAIVSIRGQGGPSVLLGAAYLAHLERVASKAESELTSPGLGPQASALRLLCLEVTTLLATYQETCNKYEGGPSPAKSLAAALEELDEMRKALNAQ
jgi:hypothetical protein